MKKISFGSFPLTEIQSQDRKCLDRYLIKTFSDNISISDAIRNLSVTKNLLYITPDTLMKAWMKSPRNFAVNNNEYKSDRSSPDNYDKALKRAFFILKEFYTKIKNAPFYKEYVYYPIYVEKVDRVDVSGQDGKETTVQMNYSFIILSNDLTKGLKIDEIRYDDNASLNFLYLFVEFFSGQGGLGKSIHDFNEKDYEFLVKMYQFVEKSGKDPIRLVLDLYKLLGMVKDAVNDKGSAGSITGGMKRFSKNYDNSLNDIEDKTLIRYKGTLKHKLVELLKNPSTSESDADQTRKAFIDLMNAIFKSEGLNGLYDGVDTSADLAQRYTYVYNTTKYREVLNLAKELVDYNKLDCKKVIQEDPMSFDFKVEHGVRKIETQSQIISQKYQTFFKLYVESISTYLTGLIESIMTQLDTGQRLTVAIDLEVKDLNDMLISLREERTTIQAEIAALNTQIAIHEKAASDAAAIGDTTTQAAELRAADVLIQDVQGFDTRLTQSQVQIDQIIGAKTMFSKMQSDVKTKKNDGLDDRIRQGLMAAIATDLTYVYDDAKKIFSNEMVTEGFMRLIGGQYDPTTPEGFKKLVDNGHTFPETVINDKKQEIDNPDTYMAEIAKSLDDTFFMMAEDTATAIQDQMMPIIQQSLIDVAQQHQVGGVNPLRNARVTPNSMTNMIARTVQSMQEDISKGTFVAQSLKENLHTNIYRNRFIQHILKKFDGMFKVHTIDKVIAFDKNISQLHPLIKKLVNKNDGGGKRCQYFKSFIITYEMCDHLYNTKFVADTQKFLHGLTRTPPRKLTNPMNKLQVVIEEYLGLKDNPVWIISKTDVYLSMPDDLSLTNTSILSKIPKSELMEVCKIKPSDYWNQDTMGKVTDFANKKVTKLKKKLDAAEKELTSAKNSKENKNNKQSKQNKIDQAKAKVDKIQEEISKAKIEAKGQLPNAFLFAKEEDPNKAENTELLSDAEKADLEKGKQEIEDQLLKLNPYSDEELEAMQKNIDSQEVRTHPFDLDSDIPGGAQDTKMEDSREQFKSETSTRADVDNNQSDMEEFLRWKQMQRNQNNQR